MSGATDGASELRDRLASVEVSVRCEIEANRDTFRGVPAYIVRDTVTSTTVRVSAADYAVLAALDDGRPLGDVFAKLVGDGALRAEDEERFYRFTLELHRSGLLNLPIPGGDALYERFQSRRRSAFAKKFTGFLFLQVPLFSPDRFLDRTMNLVRPVFTRTFFGAWLGLMAMAATVVIERWNELSEPVNALLGQDSWVATAVVLVMLKVIHEFGHAYACKNFGGTVPEMGVTMVVLTPLAYMDATSAWSFPRRRDRIIVSLGGMYFELIFAALGILIWAVTAPGMINSLAYQTFLLGSLVTIGFNVNPLMRFDGYYILSDILGIPNLRARSMTYVRHVFNRVALGVRNPERSLSGSLKLILASYGVSAAIYRVALVLGICTLIATKLYFVGIALGAIYVGKALVTMIARTARHLWASPETASARIRAVAVSIVLFVGLPLAFSTVEVSLAVGATGTLEHGQQIPVRSSVDGVLVDLPAILGQTVESESVLARLENPELSSRARELEARLQRADVEIGIQELSDRSAAAQTRERRAYYRDQVETADIDVENLSVLAGGTGAIVKLAPIPLGARIPRGTEIATIARGARIARFLLDAEVLTDSGLSVGDFVECRFVSYPELSVEARIEDIAASGTRRIDDVALTNVGGGDIVVDPVEQEAERAYFEVTALLDGAHAMALRSGMTLRMRLASQRRSVAQHVYKRVLVFLDRLKSR